MSDTLAGSSPSDEASIERLAGLMQMKDDASRAFAEAEKRQEDLGALYSLVGSLKKQAIDLQAKEVNRLLAAGMPRVSVGGIIKEAKERFEKQRQQRQQQEQQQQAEDTEARTQFKSPTASSTALVSDDGSATEADAAAIAGLLGRNQNEDDDAVSPMTVDTFDPEKEILKNELTAMKKKEVEMQRTIKAMKKKMDSMQSSVGISQEAQSRMAHLRGDHDDGGGEEDDRDVGDDEADGEDDKEDASNMEREVSQCGTVVCVHCVIYTRMLFSHKYSE